MAKAPPRRGVGALFTPTEPQGVQELPDARLIDVTLLVPNPSQPRKLMNDETLNELAASIRAHGVLQPLAVREAGERYEIIAGERRWKAARLANLEHVPCIVRTLSDDEMDLLALLENVQREDLNPVDEARALRGLMDRR
jgi:ParB family chromosome partitioning protein